MMPKITPMMFLKVTFSLKNKQPSKKQPTILIMLGHVLIITIGITRINTVLKYISVLQITPKIFIIYLNSISPKIVFVM